jgi:hypothetical protein
MDDGDEMLQAPRGRAARQGGRGDRLAAALRANLAKRKDQGRARARRSAEAAGVNSLNDPSARASERLQPPGQVEPSPHDSAEIIAEKSAGHGN